MTPYITAISAVVPSLLLLWYFHSRDVYPEPPRVLWTTFGLGILTIFPTLMVALPINNVLDPHALAHPYAIGLAKGFFSAAIPEEFFKLWVVVRYCMRHHEFDEPMDGIVYGVSASLGFATLENLVFVYDGGFTIAIVRALTAVPGHAFLGAIMGYYLGQAKFDPDNARKHTLLAYLVPTILHALYDFPLLSLGHLQNIEPAANVFVTLVLTASTILATQTVWAIYLMKNLRGKQLAQQGDLAWNVTPAPGQWLGWIQTLSGALSTTIGGTFTLGLIYGFIVEPPSPRDLQGFLIGGLIIGIIPLVLGLFLFTFGIRELNKKDG